MKLTKSEQLQLTPHLIKTNGGYAFEPEVRKQNCVCPPHSQRGEWPNKCTSCGHKIRLPL